jgi:predicted DNA-binding mobile mystery protein A
MTINYETLQRTQLDQQLRPLAKLHLHNRPSKGWIQAIRTALGMTTYQLAKRLGVAQSTAARWEKSESDRTITLTSLHKIADAMECDLVYALVPRKPLQKILEDRALDMLTRNAERVAHSLELEGQGTPAGIRRRMVRDEAKRLVDESPQRLWDT